MPARGGGDVHIRHGPDVGRGAPGDGAGVEHHPPAANLGVPCCRNLAPHGRINLPHEWMVCVWRSVKDDVFLFFLVDRMMVNGGGGGAPALKEAGS